MNDTLALILIAAAGGIAVNLLNLLELRNVPRESRPDFTDWIYWLPYGIWPLMGGFVAFLYLLSAFDLSPMLSFHVGASAPLIIRSMATSIPSVG